MNEIDELRHELEKLGREFKAFKLTYVLKMSDNNQYLKEIIELLKEIKNKKRYSFLREIITKARNTIEYIF